jgi:ATP-binding protein involved in chromosome partitioning
MTENEIKQLLKGVKYPGFSRDIVSFGLVKQVHLEPGRCEVRLSILSDSPEIIREIVADVEALLSQAGVASRIDVIVERPGTDRGAQARETAKALGRGPAELPGIADIVAVASGKGGVGKSTVAANLAVALAARGLRVGLLDADIYGPSVPILFGIGRGEAGRSDAEGRFLPAERHGVKLVSMGFFVAEGAPLIWRGPMLSKAINQFFRDVAWGDLDVLVLDLPPGTGDVQMTVTQGVALSGGVIVTTPQDVALADVERGVKMFQQAHMSFHLCPGCGAESHIFGDGGAARVANRFGLPLLGSIPLARPVRESGDAGSPIVVSDPTSAAAASFRTLAEAVHGRLGGPRPGNAQHHHHHHA